jgi:hypothetical protein
MKKALSELASKGAEVIRSQVGKDWDNLEIFLQEYGFTKEEDIFHLYELLTENFKELPEAEGVRDYNGNLDSDLLVKLFTQSGERDIRANTLVNDYFNKPNDNVSTAKTLEVEGTARGIEFAIPVKTSSQAAMITILFDNSDDDVEINRNKLLKGLPDACEDRGYTSFVLRNEQVKNMGFQPKPIVSLYKKHL